MLSHGNRIQVDAEVQKDIITRYQHQSAREIAKRYPFSRRIVNRVLEEAGVPRRKKNERSTLDTRIYLSRVAEENRKYSMLTDTLQTLSKKLNFTHAPLSKKRQILIDIHGAHCFYCGATPDYYEIDHVHPKSSGGDDTLNNMVLACVSCNQTKGGCGINNMHDQPRWLKEAVLRTLRLLYPYSEKQFSYTPSGRYHFNGELPVETPAEITEFGQLIERHRVASGLTKKGVIKRLNCFEKKWNNYLTRRTIFGESQLPALSKLLDIPMDVLRKAYIRDTFEYALQRPSLSQIWQKDHLQAFIESCDIENRIEAFLKTYPHPIKSTHPCAPIVRNLKIGRPPGKKGRDRIEKDLGFEVFPTKKIEVFREELKYQPPPITKAPIPPTEKASIPTRIEKGAPIPPVRNNSPKPWLLTPEARAASRERAKATLRARVELKADTANCRTEFGKALRTARIGKKMSQPELAKVLGLTKGYIAQLEAGFQRPRPITAYRFKNALGLPEAVMPPIDVSMCPTEFSKALREFRIRQGLQSKDFAKKVGVHPSTYSQYEMGNTPEPAIQKKIDTLIGKPKPKRSPNFDWTPERIEILKKGVDAEKSDTEIATELGIAPHQVQKYRKNVLKIDYRKMWTPEDITTLKKYIADGVPLEDIAIRMNRTLGSVQRRKEKLFLRYEPVTLSKHCPKTVAQLLKFKMAGWTHERIAEVFGLKQGGQISHVLIANGYHRFCGVVGEKTWVRWTAPEVETLRDCIEKEMSQQEIQSLLPNRSLPAIRKKIRQLRRRCTAEPKKPIETQKPMEVIEVKREAGLPPITVNLEMTIPEMRDAGLTIDHIAEVTGKDRVAVFQELL